MFTVLYCNYGCSELEESVKFYAFNDALKFTLSLTQRFDWACVLDENKKTLAYSNEYTSDELALTSLAASYL